MSLVVAQGCAPRTARRAVNVDHLMERLGFELWLKLETYWKRRCDLGEFVCVDRGDACTCEAVFYRKKVF